MNMQLIIDTSKTALTVKNSSFYISNQTIKRLINPNRIDSIAITTHCNINAAAIKLAAQQQIPIYFFDTLGEVQARLCSPYFTNLAKLRRQQLQLYDSPAATQWVISMLKRKTTLQIQTLKQQSRFRMALIDPIEKDITNMGNRLENLEMYANQPIDLCRNHILGIEGNLSKIYFKNISLLMPKPFKFIKRSRQPALDYFNAALNYLYGMTYSVVESGVFAKGFDPFAGFLHTDNYLKTSLVFDIIEPFRPFIDRILIDLINNNMIDPSHFEEKNPGFWLNKKGKHIIIPAFNDHLEKRIKAWNKVMRLKDHIYNESFELGRIIDKHFKMKK